VPVGLLEASSTLFFFGSKRCWVFPRSPEEAAEAAAQGSTYTGIPSTLRELIARKEERGEVRFLKPDVLGEPDVAVFGDYSGASTWLQLHGLGPLRLDPGWWRSTGGFRGGRHVGSGAGATVAANFQTGLHRYPQVMELLEQSDPHVEAILHWPPPPALPLRRR